VGTTVGRGDAVGSGVVVGVGSAVGDGAGTALVAGVAVEPPPRDTHAVRAARTVTMTASVIILMAGVDLHPRGHGAGRRRGKSARAETGDVLEQVRVVKICMPGTTDCVSNRPR